MTIITISTVGYRRGASAVRCRPHLHLGADRGRGTVRCCFGFRRLRRDAGRDTPSASSGDSGRWSARWRTSATTSSCAATAASARGRRRVRRAQGAVRDHRPHRGSARPPAEGKADSGFHAGRNIAERVGRGHAASAASSRSATISASWTARPCAAVRGARPGTRGDRQAWPPARLVISLTAGRTRWRTAMISRVMDTLHHGGPTSSRAGRPDQGDRQDASDSGLLDTAGEAMLAVRRRDGTLHVNPSADLRWRKATSSSRSAPSSSF